MSEIKFADGNLAKQQKIDIPSLFFCSNNKNNYNLTT